MCLRANPQVQMAYKLKTALGTVIYRAQVHHEWGQSWGSLKRCSASGNSPYAAGRPPGNGRWSVWPSISSACIPSWRGMRDALGARVTGCDPAQPDGLAPRHLWRGLILFYHHGFAFVAGPSGPWWRAFSPTGC